MYLLTWVTVKKKKKKFRRYGNKLFFFFLVSLATSIIFIQEITAETKLIQYWKVGNQNDTIKKLGTKLKYDIKDRDQIRSLLINIFSNIQTLYIHITIIKIKL